MGHDPHLLYIHENMVRRIAVFRALYLGDLLCIVPAMRALRAAYPQAEITLIGLSWQREFVKRFSHYFDAFMEFPGWPGLPEKKADPREVDTFLKEIQERDFDLVLQMQGNGAITNAMVQLFGANYTAGLRRENEFCPDEISFPVSEDHDHEILRFLKLTRALNIPDRGTHLEFPISEDEWKNFDTIRHAVGILPGKYVCIHPGARDPARRWPVEKFAAVGDAVSAAGYTVVLTGSGEESELLDCVQKNMRAPVVNLVHRAGHVGIGELAAILKHAALLVSNDTGVSHVAAALETPSVIIFSSRSDPGRWAPLNVRCHNYIPAALATDEQAVRRIISGKLKTATGSSLLLHQE